MNKTDPTIHKGNSALAQVPTNTNLFDDMPDELVEAIFLRLDSAKDVAVSAGPVCKRFYAISKDDLIWKTLFLRQFPREEATNGYLALYKEHASLSHRARLGLCTLQPFRAHALQIDGVQFDGTHVYTLYRGSVHVRNIAEGTSQIIQDGDKKIRSIHCDGEYIYMGLSDGKIRIFDKKTQALIQEFQCPQGFDASGCIRVCGNCLYAGSFSGAVTILDISDLEHIKCVLTLSNPKHLGLTKKIRSLEVIDGRLVTLSFDKRLTVWDLAKEAKEPIRMIEGIYSFKVIKGCLYAGSSDGSIKILDIESGECLKSLQAHSQRVPCLEVVRDLFFTASLDGTIKIWDINTNQSLQTLKWEYDIAITSLNISGNRVCAGGINGTMMIWDFGFTSLSSHPLRTLEKNVAILEEMAAMIKDQKYGQLISLADGLHVDFQSRIEDFCLWQSSKFGDAVLNDAVREGNQDAMTTWVRGFLSQGPTQSSRLHELMEAAVLQTHADVCIEILLHAVQNQNAEKVSQTLDQLESLNPKLAQELYEFLAEGCGIVNKRGRVTDPLWGGIAFRDPLGESAPLFAKIRALHRLKETLKPADTKN